MKLTVDESLNELLGACVRPPLLVDRSKNARGVILLQQVVLGVLLQGAVVGEKAANGLSINLASGEVDETLGIFTAVLNDRQSIHKVAVDGVQGPGVVVSWCADGSQVDNLKQIQKLMLPTTP